MPYFPYAGPFRPQSLLPLVTPFPALSWTTISNPAGSSPSAPSLIRSSLRIPPSLSQQPDSFRTLMMCAHHCSKDEKPQTLAESGGGWRSCPTPCGDACLIGVNGEATRLASGGCGFDSPPGQMLGQKRPTPLTLMGCPPCQGLWAPGPKGTAPRGG